MCPTCNHPKLNYEPQLSFLADDNIYRCAACRALTDADEVEALIRKNKILKFSPREISILHQLTLGSANKVIAANLGLTKGTLRYYLSRLYDKTRMSRVELIIELTKGTLKI